MYPLIVSYSDNYVLLSDSIIVLSIIIIQKCMVIMCCDGKVNSYQYSVLTSFQRPTTNIGTDITNHNCAE